MRFDNGSGEVSEIEARVAILELVCPILQSSDANHVVEHAQILFDWVMTGSKTDEIGG